MKVNPACTDCNKSEGAFQAIDKKYYDRLGITREPMAWEDGFRSTGKAGEYEWWYCDFEFQDHIKVVLVFYTKYKFDIAGPSHPTAQLEITLPDGRLIRKDFSEAKGKLISASREKCDVKIGESYIRYVNGNYEVHYQDDEITFDGLMKPKMKMWRPATGFTYYGRKEENYLAWFVAVPAADVTATLKIGSEHKILTGRGYHDHNWGNIAMNKICNHWYWARVVFDDYTLIATDFITEKKYGFTRLPTFMIAKGEQIITDDGMITEIIREDTIKHPVTKKFVDNTLTFIQRISDGSVYQVRLRRSGDMISVSLLENLKWPVWAIRVARLVGINPTYTRHVGTAELMMTDPQGEKKVIRCEAIWEQMFFGSNREAMICDCREGLTERS